MKEKISALHISLKPNTISENKLEGLFPDHTVIYKPFLDHWSIKNKSFHHLLRQKEACLLLTTKKSRKYPEVVVLNLVIALAFLLFNHFDTIYRWTDNTNLIFTTIGLMFAIMNWLVFRAKPKYQKAFADSHTLALQQLESLDPKFSK